MLKLLIADVPGAFADSLAKEFSGDFQVKHSVDGNAALRDLAEFEPDVLVLNFFLPYKDGMDVLRESSHIPRIVIGLTPYLNDYTVYMAAKLYVKYILRIPTSIQSVRDQLTELLNATNDREFQIGSILHRLGFQIRLDGYRRLCAAIAAFAENPDMRMSKELYPLVARQMAVEDPRTVERSIRSSITDAWLHRDPAVWNQYFPQQKDSPSNKEFIARLAEELRQMSR